MIRPIEGSIAVLGLGYIGLPTAAVFARSGAKVIGVDVNEYVVKTINSGDVHIVEPGLKEEVSRAVNDGTLKATTVMPRAETYIVAVPTPLTLDKKADLSFITEALTEIAPMLQGGELIILESTSPPGTTELLKETISKLRPDLFHNRSDADPSIHIAYCPERVLPGNILHELTHNDRIIGGYTREAAQRASEVYARICKGELHITDAKTAELTKLVENAYRDVNIAFANELSMISEFLDINVWDLIDLANKHPRVNILKPGPGVGGHCIAVDPWFIIQTTPSLSKLISKARAVNEAKAHWVIDQVQKSIDKLTPSAIAIFGITFKENIDDLRGSPALKIAKDLAAKNPNIQINIVEPNIESLPSDLANFSNVLMSTADEQSNNAEFIVVLVDHIKYSDILHKVSHEVIWHDYKGILRPDKDKN